MIWYLLYIPAWALAAYVTARAVIWAGSAWERRKPRP